MDDLSDVSKGFIHRLPLAVATLEERTLYYVEAILILLDEDRDLRVLSFRLGTFVRASHTSNRTRLHGKNQTAKFAHRRFVTAPPRAIICLFAAGQPQRRSRE